MIRAVLDTNVLLTGLAGLRLKQSIPGEVIRQWRAGSYELVVSMFIIDELERGLTKRYFVKHVDLKTSRAMLQELAKRATLVTELDVISGLATHPSDDHIIAAAQSGNADVIVTGDAGMLSVVQVGSIPIVTPRAFLDDWLISAS